MIRLAHYIAFLTVRHPRLLALTAAAIALIAGATIFFNLGLDSEVLNLLPAEKNTVQGLKLYNQKFSQGRTLVFVVAENPDQINDSYNEFISELRRQPWVLRVLDGSPLESPAGRSTLAAFATPLLFRLSSHDFAQAIEQLKPASIRHRMEVLITQLRGDSLLARLQLSTDPLGIFTLAARPLTTANVFHGQDNNASGPLKLVPVIIRQPSLSEKDASRVMRKVDQFIARFTQSHPGFQISVTGRSAYVDQVSRSMKRDFTISSLFSILLIAGLFFTAFRRLVPLLGSTLLLLLAATVALAIGSLLFGQLNIIAVAFCSILFGLGNDCSLLLYQTYLNASARGASRQEAIVQSIQFAFPSIACATLTNAVGFSALTLSGSAGFSQLGVLTAAGLGACAVLMCIFFFLFVRAARPPQWDPLQAGLNKWFFLTTRHPTSVLFPTLILLLFTGLLSFSSWRPLRFDTSSNSLEPSQIPAARALHLIRSEFPSSPLLIVVPIPDPRNSAQIATQLDQCLRSLGRPFSSPLPFIPQSPQENANVRMLHFGDVQAARAQFSVLLQQNAFHPSAFGSTFMLLNFLETAARTDSPPEWKQILPQNAPWWFLIDRFISSDASTMLAYVWPKQNEDPAEVSSSITCALQKAGITAYVSGLQETLDELIPWAVHQLRKFGMGAGLVILLILALAYRNLSLCILHALSLIFALGALVGTLKLLNLPINLLNLLAFPLILGVSVDYGAFLILAYRRKVNFGENVAGVMKPIFISALSNAMGFGCLLAAENPSLRALGIVCALGVLWALITAFLMILPALALLRKTPPHPAV